MAFKEQLVCIGTPLIVDRYLELEIASILKEFLEVAVCEIVPKRIVSGLKWLREAATICTLILHLNRLCGENKHALGRRLRPLSDKNTT